jgi:hypothetical protein
MGAKVCEDAPGKGKGGSTTTASSKARARLKGFDVNVKIKLARLWVALMFFYLYRDVLGFMEPGHVEDLMTGELAGVRMTEAVLLGARC